MFSPAANGSHPDLLSRDPIPDAKPLETGGSRQQAQANPADEAVLEALRRLADGDEVCATIRQYADACGLGERAVCRSLRGLVQRGQIVPMGKRGKTTVFRLSPSSPGAETPSSRRDSPPRGSSSSSTNGRSAAHSTPAASAVEEVELTAEQRAEIAARARAFADRLNRGPSAIVQRRRSFRDEPFGSRRPDVSERYFEPRAA